MQPSFFVRMFGSLFLFPHLTDGFLKFALFVKANGGVIRMQFLEFLLALACSRGTYTTTTKHLKTDNATSAGAS